MTKLANKYVLALACAAIALAAPQRAHAEGEKKEGVTAGGSVGLGGVAGSADAKGPEVKTEGEGKSEGKSEGKKESEHGEGEHGEHAEHAEEAETTFQVGLDAVFGFGKLNTVSASLPGTLATVPDASLQPSKIATQSFIFSGMAEVAKGVGLGLRLPLTAGRWSSEGQGSRSAGVIGNLELEGEYAMHLNPQMRLMLGLGLALPTAQGSEVPDQEEIDADKAAALQNQPAYDRGAIQHAAAASRGYLDNALFETKRFGIIPMVGLDYTVSHVLIDPFVKLENLISTSGSPEHKYIGELVLGTFLGYELAKQVDVGARVWANVIFAGEKGAVGVVEPTLRFHFGNVHPLVAGILPFAGSALTNPQFGGIRVAVNARF